VTVHLHDVADLLEPDVTVDSYTEAESPDWSKPPLLTLAGVPFQASPVSSTEQTVTAETIISRWKAYLPPAIKDPADETGETWLQLETVLTSAWRIRWDGEIYLIDGDVERHKHRRCTRYLSVLLKKVTG
jgi:hypothetical protein